MLTVEELHIRAALFRTIRSFFADRHFLEVDTPIRQPVIIPESNIIPIPSAEQFLQTSPELCMKRLMAAGSGNIFQICPCFRKEERGRRHLEEFTMLEWYRIDADYTDLMRDCEELLRYCLVELHRQFPTLATITADTFLAGEQCNISLPWRRISVAEVFKQCSPLPLAEALANDSFDEILVEYIEPRLGCGLPTFLFDYPATMASLARKRRDDPSVAERFELYINGVELANGFSELTDAVEQRSRFEVELRRIREGTGQTMQMPERFLADLEHMEDSAGIALGVDRLLMLILGKERVGEAVNFSPDDFT